MVFSIAGRPGGRLDNGLPPVITPALLGPANNPITGVNIDPETQAVYTSAPFLFNLIGPYEMTVVSDYSVCCKNCDTTVQRNTQYRVLNSDGSPAANIPIGEIIELHRLRLLPAALGVSHQQLHPSDRQDYREQHSHQVCGHGRHQRWWRITRISGHSLAMRTPRPAAAYRAWINGSYAAWHTRASSYSGSDIVNYGLTFAGLSGGRVQTDRPASS